MSQLNCKQNGKNPENGDYSVGTSSQIASDQVEALLLPAVDLVLKWIREGEKPEALLTKWKSNTEVRENVKLTLPETSAPHDELLAAFGSVLDNSINPWTGRFLDKLYAAPHPIGFVGDLLLSAINANAHVMSASPMLTLCEEKCVAGIASLLGFDEKIADGLTMPGGSASNTLAVQTSLANVFPTYQEGGLLSLGVRPILFTSEQSHYSLDKAAISCGLGLGSVWKVPCNQFGRMDPKSLEQMISELSKDSKVKPFFVNATAGSTVLGSFDDLEEIGKVCEKHRIWLHIDGSWGGPVIFSNKWKSLMQGSSRAQSVTMNPHKLLNVPHQCSFLIFRSGSVLNANALDASYLFHSKGLKENAGMKTMGCGRRGDCLKMLLAWLQFGREGFGEHVDRGMDLARRVVKKVQNMSERLELGPTPEPLFLQVCFRPRSSKADASVGSLSEATRKVHATIRERRRFAVDFAPLPGGIGDFIRLVVHPSTKWEDLEELIEEVASIGEAHFSTSAKNRLACSVPQ